MKLFRWIAAAGLAAALSGPATAAVITNEADFLAQTTTTLQTFTGIDRNAAASQSFTDPTFTVREVGNIPALAVKNRGQFTENNPDADTNRVLGYDRTPSENVPNPTLEFDFPIGTTALGFHLESVALAGQGSLSGVWAIVARGNTTLGEFFFEHGQKLFFGFIDENGLDPLSFFFYAANGVDVDASFEAQVRVLIDNVQVGGIRDDPSIIPLPAAFPLLGGAMGILGFIGWRRRRAMRD